MGPRFLADMNLSPLPVAALQADGYDILRVSSLLPATTADSVILEEARQREMVRRATGLATKHTLANVTYIP